MHCEGENGRNLLIAAAEKRTISEEKLAEHLKQQGIPVVIFNAKDTLNRYNQLMKEDEIKNTPTVVIMRNGQKELAIGGPAIAAALKRLQQDR